MAIIPFYDKCLELELVDDDYWWQDAMAIVGSPHDIAVNKLRLRH